MINNPSTNLLRVILIGVGITWGLGIAIAPLLLQTGIHPMPFIFWQALISSIVLSIGVVWHRKRLPLGPRYVLFFAVMALVGNLLPRSLSLAASEHIAVSVRAIMFALIPMISLGFGLLLKVENWRKLAGLGLGFLAMAIITLFGADTAGFSGQTLSFFWFGVMLLAGSLFAFDSNWVKLMMPPAMNPFTVLLGASVFIVILFLPVLAVWPEIWFGLPIDFTGEHGVPTVIFWVVTITSLGAHAGLIFCIDKGGPAFAAQASCIITASGVIWGLIIFQGERLSWPIILALFVVLARVALVNPSRRPQCLQTD